MEAIGLGFRGKGLGFTEAIGQEALCNCRDTRWQHNDPVVRRMSRGLATGEWPKLRYSSHYARSPLHAIAFLSGAACIHVLCGVFEILVVSCV